MEFQRCESTDSDDNDIAEFLTDGILGLLQKPLVISAFCDQDIQELTNMKQKADENILRGLQEILDLEITDVDNVKSIFETPGFFSDVLDYCKEDINSSANSSINLGSDSLSTTKVNDGSHDSSCTSEQHKSDIESSCSIRFGHIRMNPNNFKTNLSDQHKKYSYFDCDGECEYITNNEETKFIAIDTPPITPSVFKLVDINSFLSQAQFCDTCINNKKHSNIDYKLYEEETSEIVQSRSYLKLNKVSLKCRGMNLESQRLSPAKFGSPLITESTSNKESFSNLSKEVSNPKVADGIISPEICEDSVDSGVFEVYSKGSSEQDIVFNETTEEDTTIGNFVTEKLKHLSGMKIQESEVRSAERALLDLIAPVGLSPKKQKETESRLEINDSYNVFKGEKTQINKKVKLDCEKTLQNPYVDSATNQQNISKDISASSPDTVDATEKCKSVIQDIENRLRQLEKCGNKKKITKKSKRKVFLGIKKKGKDNLKNSKKSSPDKKRKKKKKLHTRKKVSINLSPPPGVDIDEHLQQQIFLIKAKLRAHQEVEDEYDLQQQSYKNNLTPTNEWNEEVPLVTAPQQKSPIKIKERLGPRITPEEPLTSNSGAIRRPLNENKQRLGLSPISLSSRSDRESFDRNQSLSPLISHSPCPRSPSPHYSKARRSFSPDAVESYSSRKRSPPKSYKLPLPKSYRLPPKRPKSRSSSPKYRMASPKRRYKRSSSRERRKYVDYKRKRSRSPSPRRRRTAWRKSRSRSASPQHRYKPIPKVMYRSKVVEVERTSRYKLNRNTSSSPKLKMKEKQKEGTKTDIIQEVHTVVKEYQTYEVQNVPSVSGYNTNTVSYPSYYYNTPSHPPESGTDRRVMAYYPSVHNFQPNPQPTPPGYCDWSH